MKWIRTAVVSGLCFATLASGAARAQSPAAAAPEGAAASSAAGLTRETLKLGRIDLEVVAPKGVSRKLLLSQLPVRAPSASDSEYMEALEVAFNNARQLLYPEAQIGLVLSREADPASPASPTPKSTSGTVDLYKKGNFWNWTSGPGGYLYAYNYYVNTVMCIIDPSSGSWDVQRESNGTWSYCQQNALADGICTATGPDDYKGCYFTAKSSSNKANLHYYFFN